MDISMKVKNTPCRSRSIASLNQQKTVKHKIENALSKFRIYECLPSCSTSALDFPVVWNELRSNRQLCDGVVKCENGQEFKVHRAILSAVSPYFKALFTNSINRGQPEETEAEIRVPSKIFNLILDYAYCGNCDIDSDNVQILLAYADQLEVLGVVELCSRYIIEHLSPLNALQMLQFAKNYFCRDLYENVAKYIRYNFKNIVEYNDDFKHLTEEELYSMVSDDALNAKNEIEVFDAIRKWVEQKPEERKCALAKMLFCVRFGLMNIAYFNDQVLKWKLLLDDAECRDIVGKAATVLETFQDHGVDYRYPLARPRVPYEIFFAIGGWSAGSPTNFVETYDSRADRWLLSSNTDQTPRAYHGTCTMDGLIYIIGGFDGYEHFNTVRSFNPVNYEWREHACMYYPRCYVSVAMLDNKIYAMGGYNGRTRMNSVERYDPDSNQWELIASMLKQRSDASAAVLDNKIYIVGGFNGQEVLRSAEVYDPVCNQWSFITSMNDARSGVSLVALNGFLYALGGFDGFERLPTCEQYHPSQGRWQQISYMINPRSNFAAVVLDQTIFVIGGFNGNTTIPDVEFYDIEMNQWFDAMPMNLNRSALSACVVAGLPNAKEYSYMCKFLHRSGMPDAC